MRLNADCVRSGPEKGCAVCSRGRVSTSTLSRSWNVHASANGMPSAADQPNAAVADLALSGKVRWPRRFRMASGTGPAERDYNRRSAADIDRDEASRYRGGTVTAWR